MADRSTRPDLDPRIVEGAVLRVYEPNEFVNAEPIWPQHRTEIVITVGRLSETEFISGTSMKFFERTRQGLRERYVPPRRLKILEVLDPGSAGARR